MNANEQLNSRELGDRYGLPRGVMEDLLGRVGFTVKDGAQVFDAADVAGRVNRLDYERLTEATRSLAADVPPESGAADEIISELIAEEKDKYLRQSGALEGVERRARQALRGHVWTYSLRWVQEIARSCEPDEVAAKTWEVVSEFNHLEALLHRALADVAGAPHRDPRTGRWATRISTQPPTGVEPENGVDGDA